MSRSGWQRLALGAGGIVVVVGIVIAYHAHAATQAESSGAGERHGRSRDGSAPSVIVATSRSADVSVYLNGLGTVTASSTVLVKSRVDGQLMSLAFREGQLVKANDVLAELDPRPFQVQVMQAEGQLARDEALLRNARTDLDRYKTLQAQDSITKQQLDTQDATVQQLAGIVEADQGQLGAARLQLSYAHITSPIDGRVGLRQVDVGNQIHASDPNGLVVITQLQPVNVVFAVPEDNVQQIVKSLATGEKLSVEAWDRSLQHRLANGTLLTADNEIDPATGTIKLKAQFANDDSALFPNQFVNARLLLSAEHGATVVPSAAVLRGAQGPYVYVLNDDQTVVARAVKPGAIQGDDSAITEGLEVGERVVVDNTDKLRDGMKVQAATTEHLAARTNVG
jgi:multidrug efflux system membrane fusion protein